MRPACRWKLVGDDLPLRLVAGAMAISGLYDLEPLRHTPFLQADLKLTPTQVRNATIGFVFQRFHLLRDESARRNVELPLLYAGLARAERRRRALAALDEVGLANLQNDMLLALTARQTGSRLVTRDKHFTTLCLRLMFDCVVLP